LSSLLSLKKNAYFPGYTSRPLGLSRKINTRRV
jgi:hypothetical protein